MTHCSLGSWGALSLTNYEYCVGFARMQAERRTSDAPVRVLDLGCGAG